MASSIATPVILLDFDGTLCLGDGPVLAYAEAALAGVGAADAADAAEVRRTLADFLGGRLGARWVDGYEAVADLLSELVDPATLARAYAESRRALSLGDIDVHAPAGVHAFLDGLEGVAERVLLTNAPLSGVAETLDRLGLTSRLDRILPEAHKPAGWSAALPDALAGRPARLAVSVGDVFRNDLEPLLPTGAATAFLDRFGATPAAAPTWTAPSFPPLYPVLTEWLHSARL